MNIVISNPKTGKAYSKKVDNMDYFLGKKIGQTVDLSAIGLSDYHGKISGGCDKQGFPMKGDLPGEMRRKIFVTIDEKHGIKKRRSWRGNAVSNEIQQLNIRIIKHGSKKLEEFFAEPKTGEKEEKLEKKASKGKEKKAKEKKEEAKEPKEKKEKAEAKNK